MNRDKRVIQAIFLILLISIGVISVIQNQGHLAEQGIYRRHHKILGVNLWSGFGYRYDPINHREEVGFPEYQATYPLWGYPIIVGLLQNDLIIEIIQVTIVISLIFTLCRKYLDSVLPIILVLLVFPVALHASVKWADSWYIISLLVILLGLIRYSEKKDVKYLVILCITGFICVNIRPDFFYFIIFATIVGMFLRLIRIPISVVLLGAMLGIIPWMIYTWNVTGRPLIGSTNGGLVAYITLGQLPDNAWGRNHDDNDGIDYVKKLGVELATSYRADIILKSAFLEDIRNYPMDFLRKVRFNFLSAILGGVYNGEGVFPKLFTIIFLWITIGALIVYTTYLFGHDIPDDGRVALYFSWIVLMFSLIWVSVLQYQPRHMNGAYVVMLISWIILKSTISAQHIDEVESRL